MTARQRHDDGTSVPPSPPPSWVSPPTVDLYLPASQPRCLSSGSPSHERHQRAWIFLASVHQIERALHPKCPSLRIFPASRAFNLWLPQRICPPRGGCVWGASRPNSVKMQYFGAPAPVESGDCLPWMQCRRRTGQQRRRKKRQRWGWMSLTWRWWWRRRCGWWRRWESRRRGQ